MTEDEAGALGWMIRTVDWSESKCGEINPKGRYTGLVRDPSEQQAHNRGGVQEGHPWIHGRGIKTAGFSHKGCNLPSTDVPNFSTESRNVTVIERLYLWCDDCYQPQASASMTLSVAASSEQFVMVVDRWVGVLPRQHQWGNQPWPFIILTHHHFTHPHSSSSESSPSWWTSLTCR